MPAKPLWIALFATDVPLPGTFSVTYGSTMVRSSCSQKWNLLPGSIISFSTQRQPYVVVSVRETRVLGSHHQPQLSYTINLASDYSGASTDVCLCSLMGDSTEVTGGGYTRQRILAVDQKLMDMELIKFPVATTTWGRITSFAIMDAEVGGNILFQDSFGGMRDTYTSEGFSFLFELPKDIFERVKPYKKSNWKRLIEDDPTQSENLCRT